MATTAVAMKTTTTTETAADLSSRACRADSIGPRQPGNRSVTFAVLPQAA